MAIDRSSPRPEALMTTEVAARLSPPIRYTPLPSPVNQEQEEDSSIIVRCLNGDSHAFTALYDRYAPRLRNFAYRAIGDRERAEELVQEAFLRTWEHLPRFDGSKKFSTWVYTITANLAKNELRDRSRNPLVCLSSLGKEWKVEEDRPLQFEDPKADTSRLIRSDEFHHIIWIGINTLIPKQRRVFILREIDGRSYGEIACITKAPLGTIKTQLSRARQAFAIAVWPYWVD